KQTVLNDLTFSKMMVAMKSVIATEYTAKCPVCGEKMAVGEGVLRGEVGEKGVNHAYVLAEVDIHCCPNINCGHFIVEKG
ncbi:hypothetical protein, partial [Acetonema longum]